MRERVNVRVVASDEAARSLADELAAAAPGEIGLDFETASVRGFGVRNGALRLIQIGVDHAGAGQPPEQIILDCFRADPRPLTALLQDQRTTKLVHNAQFERSWAAVQLDSPILGLYDTCAAWKAIQKRLGALDLDEAQRILPGWTPHDNTLGTLVGRYLGVELPKGNQRSDWGQGTLRDDQLLYAAVDVAVLGELARFTRQIAARLGLTDSLQEATDAAGDRAWVRSREVVSGDDDERLRVQAALLRASTLSDLDRQRLLARQVPLTGVSRRALDVTYEQTRSRLLTGAAPPSAPAPTAPLDATPF